MAITYTDKVQNVVNPLPVTEQWRAVDANEVKNEVNTNITATAAAASAASTAQSDIDTHEALTNNPHSVTASQVGLGNVNNTSDANKPVSTAQQTALDLKQDAALVWTAHITSPGGFASFTTNSIRYIINGKRVNLQIVLEGTGNTTLTTVIALPFTFSQQVRAIVAVVNNTTPAAGMAEANGSNLTVYGTVAGGNFTSSVGRRIYALITAEIV